MAWRRTLLGLTAVTLGALRFLPEAVGAGGIALPAVALCTTAGLAWAVRRRTRRTDQALADGDPGLLPGGGILAVLSGTVVLLGLGGLALAVAR